MIIKRLSVCDEEEKERRQGKTRNKTKVGLKGTKEKKVGGGNEAKKNTRKERRKGKRINRKKKTKTRKIEKKSNDMKKRREGCVRKEQG